MCPVIFFLMHDNPLLYKDKNAYMKLFDFNSFSLDSSYNPPQYYLRRFQDEFRKNGLCSTDSASAALRVQSMRPSPSRQLQGQKFFMHGPVSLHGVCSTNLSRKPAGHRNVSQLPSIKALSHRLSGEDRQVHLGGRQPLSIFACPLSRGRRFEKRRQQSRFTLCSTCKDRFRSLFS